METTLRELLQRAGNWSDEIAGARARLQLGLLFEFKNRPAAWMSAEYEELLPAELRSTAFGEEEQADVVAEVCRLVPLAPTEPARTALLSSLTHALPWVALGPALGLLLHDVDLIGYKESRYQLLAAVNAMLMYVWLPVDDPRRPRLIVLRDVIRTTPPDECLRRLASSPDEHLARVSRSIQEKLAALQRLTDIS